MDALDTICRLSTCQTWISQEFSWHWQAISVYITRWLQITYIDCRDASLWCQNEGSCSLRHKTLWMCWIPYKNSLNEAWGLYELRCYTSQARCQVQKLREVTSSNFFILVSANELLFHLRLWIHPHVVSSNWEFFIVVCICSRLKSLSECYCNRLIKDLIEMHLKMFFEIVIFDWYCDHKQLRMLFNCFDCFFVCKFFDWGP